jgi:hypothetical protein
MNKKRIFRKKGRAGRKKFPNWKTYLKWKLHEEIIPMYLKKFKIDLNEIESNF